MTSIRDRIENNIVVWTLAMLLAGFVSGIATYEGALKIMQLEKVSKDRLLSLEKGVQPSTTEGIDIFSVPLPDYLNSSEITLILERVKSAYNEQDVEKLYNLLGPIRRAQLTLNTARLQIEPVFASLGAIESAEFVYHQFMGRSGMYKMFALYYSAKYEKADKGVLMISLIDNGKSYQIDGMIFNRL